MYDARFCFVVYEDIEQEEAGDTFTHTFIWRGWEECQTRYFYFWATSEGEKMLSTSPIFSKHFTPPLIFTAVCDTLEGDASGPFIVGYQEAHDALGNWSRDNWPSIACVQQHGIAGKWLMHRGALVFDTTALNPAWNIQTAVLHFCCQHIYHAGGGPLDFIDGSGLTLPFANSNFEELLDMTSILAQKARADLAVDTWYAVSLNPEKLSFINPGGLSIIAIREHHDVLSIPAGQGVGEVWGFGIWTCEQAGKEPYLVICGEEV